MSGAPMRAPMGRRSFLRSALAASAAGLWPGCRPTSTGEAKEVDVPWVPGEPLPWRNWAGTHVCRPAERAAPETEDELVALLERAPAPIRPVGAGHSFSALVPSDGTLLATDFLDGLRSSDAARAQCEVGAGTRLHRLGPLLAAEGLAMKNMPDIDYQTLAGAISTSTHGTGTTLGSLSSFIVGLTLATPSGELLECDAEREPELFAAARCSLGALGVITRIRLQCEPGYRLAQRTGFEPLADVLDDIDARKRAHRHFELLAFPHASLAQVIVTDVAEPGASQDTRPEDPDPRILRDVYRGVGGLGPVGDWIYDGIFKLVVGDETTVHAGPSYEVLTHERILRFREMEYTVPAEAGPACLREVMHAIDARGIPIVYPVELRYVKSDDIWLSMFCERDGCTISIHQYADEAYEDAYAALEPIFWKYEGRPHWGKLHTLDAARLAALYPRWQDFREIRRSLDPEGRMLNDHLRAVLGA